MPMFIDRYKIEKLYMDELTKIGNLFDTLDIDYCVVGGYALLSYGIQSRGKMDCAVMIFTEKKEKIVEMLFKLNYTISRIENNRIGILKEDPRGTVMMDLVLGKEVDKTILFNVCGKEVKLDNKFFVQNRKEVKTKKGSRGYFRTAPLELIYFLKMNPTEDASLLDLEAIKASSKMEMDKLLELFKINGLI
jgi:hypothetical protein